MKVCYQPGGLSGAGCLPVEVHVENGKIIRIKEFHIPETTRLYEIRTKRGTFTRPRVATPWSTMLAYKKRIYSPNRVKYPLRRVDWSPENRNPQNRGKSGFVRISWDEALNIIESEIKRIKEVYGTTEAVLVMDDGHGQSSFLHTRHGYGVTLFDKLGGRTLALRNPDSWEGYYFGAKHVWGFNDQVGEPMQDAVWEDVLENCEVAIYTGCDPDTTVAGFAGQIGTIMTRWLKQAGIKIVAISPDLNYSASVHADKWIPIKPGTDGALYLAIAYVWLTEGTYDKKYVKTHCIGFEEFRRYALGEEDVPKTPAWAEKITGIPPTTIRALAKLWATRKTSLFVHYGGAKTRGTMGQIPTRLEAYVLAMQGLGAPGRQFARFRMLGTGTYKKLSQIPRYPEIDVEGFPIGPAVSHPFTVPIAPFVPKPLVPDAILNPQVNWYGSTALLVPCEDQFVKYTYPPNEKHPGIHMIWNCNSCLIACWPHGYRFIEAFRSPRIEFIVACHPWLENDLLYADLILPETTTFENEDMIVAMYCDVQGLFYQDKCVEPIGESKSHYEVHRLIAQRLGVKEAMEAFPEPEEVMRSSYERSLAFTKFKISYEEFKERKMVLYDHPTVEEWEKLKKETEVLPGVPFKPGLTWFYELPEGRGLDTPTGKIEFVSQGILKHFPDDKERPPLARWVEHDELLTSSKAKKYPLLVISNHPRWRVGSQCDDITWTREIPTCKIRGPDGYLYEPLWIHPKDATKREIKHGDIVKAYNDRGTILTAAYVTERIIPGTVYVDHGARHDPISIDERIDRGGCSNLIDPSYSERYKPGEDIKIPEMVVSSYLVEVEKVDIFEFIRKYPVAFARKSHPEAGLSYESWCVK